MTAEQAKENVKNIRTQKVIDYIYETIEQESMLGKISTAIITPTNIDDDDNDIKKELESNGFTVSLDQYIHACESESYWSISWE